MLRAVYLMVTCSVNYTPGRHTKVTTTGVQSKVGLAREQYQDLQVDGNILSSRRQHYKNLTVQRDAAFQIYLEDRKKEVKNYKQDIEGIEKILKFVVNTKIPGFSGDHAGQWQHFAHVVNLVIQRRKNDASRETTETISEIPDAEDEPIAFENNFGDTDEEDRKSSIERKMRATYASKTSKDYVPALRIVGTLSYLEEWRRREHLWLTEADITEIYYMEVLIVARYAPINPSKKDFCLSFTLAEKKLAKCLSVAQRKSLLILKAYLKGIFLKRHAEQQQVLRLTTFHMKTVLYRLSDITDPAIWKTDDVMPGLRKVLEYLLSALDKKELMHYFVPSNLFAGFEDKEFELLTKCTQEILADQVQCIKPFFDLDDGERAEVRLTEAEILCLENLTGDGGVKGEVDRMEEAVIEMQRGFNDGPRDEQGNPPIAEAISSTGKLFLEDEATRKLKEAEDNQKVPRGLSQILGPMIPGLANAIGDAVINSEGDALMGALGQFLGSFSSSNREENRRIEEELKYRGTSYFIGRPF